MPSPSTAKLLAAGRLGARALEQLDAALVGCAEAKHAVLVSLVGRFGLLAIGAPGGGKTLLFRSGLSLIQDVQAREIVRIPPGASLAGLLAGQRVHEKRPGIVEAERYEGMVLPETRIILTQHLDLSDKRALRGLRDELVFDGAKSLIPTDGPVGGVRSLLSAVTKGGPPLDRKVAGMHALGLDFDRIVAPDWERVAEAILGDWTSVEPRPLFGWSDLDELRALATEAVVLDESIIRSIRGSLLEVAEDYGDSGPYRALRVESTAQLAARILAILSGEARPQPNHVDWASRWAFTASVYAGEE